MTNVIFAAFFYSLFQIFAGFAAPKLSEMWFIIAGTISMIFFTVFLVIFQFSMGNTLGKTSPSGLIFIFLANGAITIFTLFLGRSFQQLDSKIVIPLIFGGAILISSCIGFIVSRTIPTLTQTLSLLLISSGLFIFGITSK
jgi:hypothetical protein